MSTKSWRAVPQKLRFHIAHLLHMPESIDLIRQNEMIEKWGLRPDRTINPLTRNPRRYWSQADEDGILEHILDRIGSNVHGFFLEYGVGDGRECNTLALLSRGWSGGWISGQELIFRPHPAGRLIFQQAWITIDNILSLTNFALERMEAASRGIDVISVDLDGNDYHFTKVLLEAGIRPKVWISEYNARFPVGSRWVMPYRHHHEWAGDDYFGASISSFADLLEEHGYFPAACSAQGSNVFFVENALRNSFKDIPTELADLYQPPMYSLAPNWAHKPSALTLSSLTKPL